ncbi:MULTISPECIES: ATP-binding cassette domain-containing protein [unclassified Roseburia]|nr:ATP-binding cassette domain-containing protein [Roseburia sp. AF20-18LB]
MNFTINEGEFVVILGQSGAGKSTVVRSDDR